MMNERLKTRPKSTASAMTRSGQLNYSMIRDPDIWRASAGGASMWASDTSLLGIQGSKCTPHSWHLNINVNSGGFLPVLKAKARPATLTRRPPRRNKSAISRSLDSNNTGGRILSTNTASLMDLTTIVPSAYEKKHAKLQRENSLPSNFKVIPPPVLKYSHESSVEAVLSKLELLEGISADGDSLNSQNSQSDNRGHIPIPPSQTRNQPNSRYSLRDKDRQETNTNNVIGETKWRLNVTLPNDDNPSDNASSGATTVERQSDEIDAIKEFNNPKSILKLQNEAEQATEPPNKKVLGVSTYLLSTPLPPTTRPASSTTKKRIIRKKSANGTIVSHSRQKLENSRSAAEPLSESDSASIEPDSDSANPGNLGGKTSERSKSVRFSEQPHKINEYHVWEPSESDSASIEPDLDLVNLDNLGSKISDLPKSVRFSEQPHKVKEYYPWESPQHVISYYAEKPAPKAIKTTPVFRP